MVVSCDSCISHSAIQFRKHRLHVVLSFIHHWQRSLSRANDLTYPDEIPFTATSSRKSLSAVHSVTILMRIFMFFTPPVSNASKSSFHLFDLRTPLPTVYDLRSVQLRPWMRVCKMTPAAFARGIGNAWNSMQMSLCASTLIQLADLINCVPSV